MVLLLWTILGRADAVHLVKPRMTFAEASRPFEDFKYRYGGYVDAGGEVQNGGLGCSAYTSAVLHRMRDGNDWLKRFDLQVSRWYGDKAAEHFGLKKAGRIRAMVLLDSTTSKTALRAAGIQPGALLYFNARKDVNGHVGFVRVAGDGNGLEQWHYSSIVGKLYCGNFREWLKRSMYRDAEVEFYFVPEN